MLGKTLGRYQISVKLGAGGMGEVYRAHDERLERDVAIKVLNAAKLEENSSRKRFRKEALVLSKLNHPNIATILDFDTQEGVDFLVMEYIVGTTLSAKLEKGAMSEKEMLPYALQIATAMEEAHALGVIHRDLKPSNIFVTPKGQIKVLDFGLAKLIEQPTHTAVTKATTESNLLVGTLPYMSPEQLLSEPIDARTDIYSFGVLLYEMSTGKLPYSATQPITLANSILNKDPAPPQQLRPDMSPRLQEIILKCMDKDKEKRYQTAKELLVDLRRLATPSMVMPDFETTVAHKPFSIKPRYLTVAAVVAVVLLTAFGVYKLTRSRKASTAQQGFPEIQSVVALPSKVFGSNENLFLTDAIPNALSTQLSQIKGLETKAPPTSQDMDRIGGDISKIAQLYGVNALISSSITTDADHFRLNLQLIDSQNRNLLWSRDYDGQRQHYIELVRTAAEGLRQALRPDTSPLTSEGKANTDAELMFQRGFYNMRNFANRKQQEDFDRALADLKRTLELDPTNARAAATIARLYAGPKLESGAPLSEVLPQIDEWAYKALQLDYRCGEAWQVLSVAEEMRPGGDKRKRLEYALKGAVYAPQSGSGQHVLGVALSRTSFTLSLKATEEAIKQDPLYLNGLIFRAGILSRENRPKEGLQLIDKVFSIEPNTPIAILMKLWLLLRDHQYQEAEKLIAPVDKLVAEHKLHPGWAGFTHDWFDFEKNVAIKNKAEASAALQRLVSQARGEAPPFPRWESVTGTVLGMQAQYDSVDSTLQTLSMRASKNIFEPYDWLILNKEIEPIRKDKRFAGLVERSKTEFEDMLKVLEAARARNEMPSYLESTLAQVRSLKIPSSK